jgi:hypothetical protein
MAFLPATRMFERSAHRFPFVRVPSGLSELCEVVRLLPAARAQSATAGCFNDGNLPSQRFQLILYDVMTKWHAADR